MSIQPAPIRLFARQQKSKRANWCGVPRQNGQQCLPLLGFGAHGKNLSFLAVPATWCAHELGILFDEAGHLRARLEIALIIIGEDNQKESPQTEATQSGLVNVIVKHYKPKENLKVSLTQPDVHPVSLNQIPAFIAASPAGRWHDGGLMALGWDNDTNTLRPAGRKSDGDITFLSISSIHYAIHIRPNLGNKY